MSARWSVRFVAAVAASVVIGAMAVVPAGATARRGAAGDTITIGAEQEPDCADWISSCAGASWGVWTMMEHTMPRAFDVVKKGGKYQYTPSVLLAGEPKLETKGGQQVVTYEISEDAVWSDTEPITSTDFKYTWDQIATGEDIYDATGYKDIESIDDSDPKVAVVTFSQPFAPWRGLFGGGLYGIYPSHLLEGKDRNAEMLDGYTFSGGPYMIESWERGVAVTLVANPEWYGPAPKTDRVVFTFIPDTSAQFQAFVADEVSAIYPQPQPDAIEQITAGVEGANSFFTGFTGNAEALWMNNEAFPFDSVKVRQAFAYSIDRDAVVKRLFGALGVNKALNTLNPPLTHEFADTKAFAKYKTDLKKVNQLMTSDGWEKNADGIWEKDGEAADIEINSTTGNARRELTEQILQEQLGAAGFNLTIVNHSAGDLFGQILPDGDYQLGLYAQVSTQLEPSNCPIFCSENIPTEANGNVGQNWQRVDLPGLDDLLTAVDQSTDAADIANSNKKADKIEARNVASLPLDPLPNIALWSKSLKGPKGDHPIFGMFYNLTEWRLT